MTIRKGLRVGFEHDEVGWIEGVTVKRSPDGEEWLVRTPLGDRWVDQRFVKPPRPGTGGPASAA